MTYLTKASSAEAATWIIERLHDFAQDVGSVVPDGFQAYARVFHPAWFGGSDGRAVTWREIAASTGRNLHAAAQWPHVAFAGEIDDNRLQDPPPGAPWQSAPGEGSLDLEVAEILVARLTPHTSTPDRCWFAVWEGWAGLRPDAREAAHFEVPARDYFLFEGPIEAATETFYEEGRYQSAALWWPDDRAWCVATEVDFESTYIGGSRACIDAIVADQSLEALEVDIHQGITWDSDTVNPNPLRLRN